MKLYDQLPPAERQRIAEINADDAQLVCLVESLVRLAGADDRPVPQGLVRRRR